MSLQTVCDICGKPVKDFRGLIFQSVTAKIIISGLEMMNFNAKVKTNWDLCDSCAAKLRAWLDEQTKLEKEDVRNAD